MSEENKSTLTEDQKVIIREIYKQAKELGIDPRLAVALAQSESKFQHIPASDEKSTAFGPFQVNKATAEANGVDYEKMKSDANLAIRTGLMNLVRHANNPELGGDPMRIIAAHRMGENSDFAKTGDPSKIDPTLRSYLVDVVGQLPEKKVPDFVYQKPIETKNNENQTLNQDIGSQQTTLNQIPEALQSLGMGVAGGIATGIAGVAKYPVARFLGLKEPTPKTPTESVWPGQQTPPPKPVVAAKPPVVVDVPEKLTDAQKQVMATGDRENISGRARQTGYTERTGQIAATRKHQENIAKGLGLDVNAPSAKIGNVASTESGVIGPQTAIDQLQADKIRQAELRSEQIRSQNQVKLNQSLQSANKVGQNWQQVQAALQSKDPAIFSWGEKMLAKMKSALYKPWGVPGAKFGAGAGMAVPYAIDLAREQKPGQAAGAVLGGGLLGLVAPRALPSALSLAEGAKDVAQRTSQNKKGEALASALATAAQTVAPFAGAGANVLAAPLTMGIPLYLAASDRLKHLEKHPEDYRLENNNFDPLGNPIMGNFP